MRHIIIFIFIISGCTQTIGSNTSSKLCSLKPETGRCRAAIPRYYFDKISGSCKAFIWGGCGGVVPFEMQSECSSMCIADINSEYLEKLDKSLSMWKHSKNKNGNSYQYSTDFSSWVGFGNETTIGVDNDIVVRREYHSWDSDGNQISQWNEYTPNKLGTNKDGAPLKIIEELYEDCHEILSKKDEEDNYIHLAFDENGIIKHCFFFPKNCADDCSSGVLIKDFSFQK